MVGRTPRRPSASHWPHYSFGGEESIFLFRFERSYRPSTSRLVFKAIFRSLYLVCWTSIMSHSQLLLQYFPSWQTSGDRLLSMSSPVGTSSRISPTTPTLPQHSRRYFPTAPVNISINGEWSNYLCKNGVCCYSKTRLGNSILPP
jgi:hypothetical protein